jgi:glutamine amidotransferase
MQVTDFPLVTGLNTASAQRIHGLNVVVIDYEFGNVRSVVNALEALGAQVLVSRHEVDLHRADCLILPGVGAFGEGMANLKRFGLVPVLNELVLQQKKPFLGICVGMQLLAKTGYEGGEFEGLGWVDADVVRLSPENLPIENQPLKVPHVGWNDVTVCRDNTLLGKTGEQQTFYFVHSYYLQCREPEIVLGQCHYGLDFPAVIQKGNIAAVQFHPEKSQKHGLRLLANVLLQACPLPVAEDVAC